MRAPAWRTLVLASACALASLVIPGGVAAQSGGAGLGEVELPPVPEPLPQVQTPATPSVGELIDTAEQETGIEIPELGGVPSAQPPSSPQAPAPEPAASPPAAPQGGPLLQGSGTPGPSPSAAGPGPSGRRAGRGEDSRGRAGAGPGERSPRRLSGAASTDARGGEEPSPVRRIFEALGGLPWSLLAAIVALAALGILMAGRSALLVRVTRRLTNQGDELREDVGALQTALLPAFPKRIGSVELSGAYRAAEGPAAGGDFYAALALDGERVAVVIGDVSGHGREALTITALVHYTVRAYLEAGMEPRQALRLADEALGGKLGGDFATVLAAIYDPETSTLRYASAGHPAPLILGGGGDHVVTRMTPPPIGVGPTTGFRQTHVTIPAKGRVCFFTDGLIERREEDGTMLGRQGLVRSFAELDNRIEAAEVLDRVAGGPGSDDVTLCIVRPLHAAGDGTVTEELELDTEADPKDLAAFLHDCGLDAEAAGAALEQISRGPGPSLLRVTRGGEGVACEVSEVAAKETAGALTAPSESSTAVLAT